MWAPPRGPPFGRQKLVGTTAVGPTSGLPCGNKKLVGTSAVGTTSVDQGRLWCHKSRFSWHPGRSKSPRSKSTFQGSFQWRPPHWCQGGPIKNLARYGIAPTSPAWLDRLEKIIVKIIFVWIFWPGRTIRGDCGAARDISARTDSSSTRFYSGATRVVSGGTRIDSSADRVDYTATKDDSVATTDFFRPH